MKYYCGFNGANNGHRSCSICNDYYKKTLTKEFLQEEYIEKQKSVVDIKEQYFIPYGRIEKAIKENDIHHRGIKESSSTKNKKEKSIETCLEKYGDVNVLGKKSPLFLKKNETVKEKYGVENVFQLEEIKEKSNNTMLKKFGVLRITDGEKQKETKKNWSEENRRSVGIKIGRARKEEWSKATVEKRENKALQLSKGRTAKYEANKEYESGIEKIVAETLEKLNISFIWSFFIGHRSYDFRILKTKYIIEVQGDYWHASPTIYLPEDVVIKENGYEVSASQLWERDKKKKEYAEKYGYSIVYIWEHDLRYKNENELKVFILNALCMEEDNENNQGSKDYQQLTSLRHTDKNSKLFCQ